MRMLALDTASEACSAALMLDGEISERLTITHREHGPLVLRLIDELLEEARMDLAGLDAIAFGRGPGSFTGLRIAAGITQGLALAADLPVLPVSDLAMLAQGLMDERDVSSVAVCLDARMGEAYVGFFRRDEQGLAAALAEEALIAPAHLELPAAGHDWVATGSGWAVFDGLAERLGVTLGPNEGARLPQARSALLLAAPQWRAGKALAAEDALPVYLRERAAWRK